MLAHHNLRFLSSTATIKADCPFANCRVVFEATVWNPYVGMKLGTLSAQNSRSSLVLTFTQSARSICVLLTMLRFSSTALSTYRYHDTTYQPTIGSTNMAPQKTTQNLPLRRKPQKRVPRRQRILYMADDGYTSSPTYRWEAQTDGWNSQLLGTHSRSLYFTADAEPVPD